MYKFGFLWDMQYIFSFNFSICLLVSFNYTRVSRAKLQECNWKLFLYLQCSIQVATWYTINKSQKIPYRELFLSGYLPTFASLDSHNTQQERLNSKLVPLSPCCALLLWVLQSSHGSQVRKQQCQCLYLLVSCASTLTKMTAPNSISPVYLPKNQVKPSSQFYHPTPQLTMLFNLTVDSKLSSTGQHCFLLTVLQLTITVWTRGWVLC